MTLTAIIFAGILTYFTRMTMIALISRDMLGDKIKAVLEICTFGSISCNNISSSIYKRLWNIYRNE